MTKCPVCGEETTRVVPVGNTYVTLPRPCKCKREEIEKEKIEDERRKVRMRDADIVRNGYLDKSYAEHLFVNDDNKDSKVFKDLTRYVAKWDEMKAKNIGLLLMGSYGTGKTFYASCIANEVRQLGDYVLIGTLPRLINEMGANYNENRRSTEEKIVNYPLMVIDDLGIERSTDYSLEQIEGVIDLRYRSHLPLIVTTNLTKTDIEAMTDMRQKRIWSRLSEMCVPYVITGTDRRREIGREKADTAKKLLGF